MFDLSNFIDSIQGKTKVIEVITHVIRCHYVKLFHRLFRNNEKKKYDERSNKYTGHLNDFNLVV